MAKQELRKFFVQRKTAENDKWHLHEVNGTFIPPIFGHKLFIHDAVDIMGYTITEFESGAALVLGLDTKTEAKKAAKNKAANLGKKRFVEGIENIKKKHGIVNKL